MKKSTSKYLIEEKMKQYHNIISQFSGYSFSIKKLFVTTIGIFIPVIIQIDMYKISKNNNNMSDLSNLLTFFSPFFFILIITLLFYIIDCTTYYYQDTMQQNLYREEILYSDNSISMYNINKEIRFSSKFNRILRTLTNISHLIYFIVCLLTFVISSLIAIQMDLKNKIIPIKIDIIAIIVVILFVFIMNLFKKKTNNKKIFISYTTKKNEMTKEKLIYLKKYLFIRYGAICFIDLLDNKKSGEKVQKEIEKQIKKSDLVIVLTSPSYKESEWVKYEINYATENKKTIDKITYNNLLSGKSKLLKEIIASSKPHLIKK